MQQIVLDAAAGQVSAELTRRGSPPMPACTSWSRSWTPPNRRWLRSPRPARASTGSPTNPTSIPMPTWWSTPARWSRTAASSHPVPVHRSLRRECRPARVVSRDNDRRSDLIVAFITSVPRTGPDMAPLAPTAGTGLKVPLVVRYDKLATRDRSVIAGKLGSTPADWLAANRVTFFGVFGFGQP